MKILSLAASNSRQSINRQLVKFAGEMYNTEIDPSAEIELIDLNDYEMPIYSIDREKENGIPELAKIFKDKIRQSDGILISFAEHNGNVTAAYKNLFDWTSRINPKVYQGKPAVLLSTSPGARGASSSLGIVKSSAPYAGLDVKAALSVASFYNNFDLESDRITNSEIQAQLETVLAALN